MKIISLFTNKGVVGKTTLLFHVAHVLAGRGRKVLMVDCVQQHNLRNNTTGMTKGWQIFGNRLESALEQHIVGRLRPLQQVPSSPIAAFNLGSIPNLHSLISYSLEARKPVFECTSADGLTAEHVQSAKSTKKLFNPIANAIEGVL